MVEFCQKYGIDRQVCGQVIVATEPEEFPFLEKLDQRGWENKLPMAKLTGKQVQ